MSPMSPRLLRPKASGLASLRRDIAAYWTLNESAPSDDVTAVDATGRGNDLTSNNSVLSATGLKGNCRVFVPANSEWLSRAANTDLQLGNNDWTLSLWAKFTTDGGILAAKDISGNREFYILAAANTRFAVFNSAGTEQSVLVSGASTNNSTWNWFCMRHTGGAITCRVNSTTGTLTRAASTTWTTKSTPWTLGARDFVGFRSFLNGSIDEVGKWNRALTDAELSTLYNNGLGVSLY